MRMGFINRKYYNLVIVITLLFALMGLTATSILSYLQIALLAIGTILIGIPHGAADNHVFYQLKKSNNFQTKVKFYSIYLSLITIVLLCWYIIPNIFLAIFLIYSAFHFGQSNWYYINKTERSAVKIIVYLLWGGFVLLTPILVNYSESILVIKSISPDSENIFEILKDFKYLIISVFITLNLVVILLFKKNNLLSPKEAVKETITLLSLTILYFTTPLYISFAVYWILYHSHSAFLDVINVVQKKSEGIRGIIDKFLPLSIISIIGIILIFYLISAEHQSQILAIFFVIIAALTVPHMLVMQMMYNKFD